MMLLPAPTNRPIRAAGFTLIEVLVSVVISAIILGAVYSGISGTFTMLNTMREDLRATQILVSRLEGMHLEAWGNGTSQPSQLFDTTLVPRTFTDYFYPLGLNSTTNQGTVYSGTVTMTTNVTLSPAASYKASLALVSVAVTWTDIQYGVTNVRTRAMSTYIARYGMQNYIYTH